MERVLRFQQLYTRIIKRTCITKTTFNWQMSHDHDEIAAFSASPSKRYLAHTDDVVIKKFANRVFSYCRRYRMKVSTKENRWIFPIFLLVARDRKIKKNCDYGSGKSVSKTIDLFRSFLTVVKTLLKFLITNEIILYSVRDHWNYLVQF